MRAIPRRSTAPASTGCGCRADVEKTDYPTLAYELGQTIGEAADDAAGNDDIA